MKQLVAILGPGRNGTSLVAQLVEKLGASMGDDLLPGNEFNPDGYFEDRSIVAIHKNVLENFVPADSYGGSLPMPEYWINHPTVPPLLDAIVDQVQPLFAVSDLAAVKDPRISSLVPLWRRVADRLGAEPKFLVCLRHPAGMAESQARATSVPSLVAESLWIARVATAFHDLGDERIIIDFDRMFCIPSAPMGQI